MTFTFINPARRLPIRRHVVFHALRRGVPAMLLAASLVLLPCWYSLASVAADTTQSQVATHAATADPMTPIIVGSRDQVGKASLGEEAASSLIGGLVGSVIGGSGRKSEQPKTRRDPTRKLDYSDFAAAAADTETRARAQWANDGLLVSSRIEESPGKGTFQVIFLENCDGQRLYPQRYEIYDLWNESSISVSWSQTRTANGQVVSQKSGGWSDGWTDEFALAGAATGATETAGEGGDQDPAGTWKQLGFDRAQGGVRQVGAYFDLSPEQLAAMGELALVVHTTRPLQDPVVTSPAQWLLAPGPAGQPQLGSATAQQRWQFSSATCTQHGSVLLASAGQVDPGSEPFEGTPRPPSAGLAATGLALPDGLVVTARGTGRTTGHIITLDVRNDQDHPIEWPELNFYIPSNGKHQSYLGRTPATPIPPGGVREIPVTGYCGDVHKPPIPAGEAAPPPSDWIVAAGAVDQIVIPELPGAIPGGRAQVPGTDRVVPRRISASDEPMLAAPLLLAALEEIERATAELQVSGRLTTPFSTNPEREREAVIQQTLWIYAAELEGEPYTREDFTQRLEQQYESRSGIPITAAQPEEQQKLQQGADDFWDSFELTGVEAKVLASPDTSAPASGTAVETEARPAPVPGTSTEVAHDGCPATEHIHHSPRQVNVSIADSYGDNDSRRKITEGIKAAVESRDPAYVTSTPPATAYSLWRDDAIGGISSAYAKSVFLEKNQQDWVWTTDPLKTEAKGTGTHTLTFKPGPQCKATVAGAALMWIKSSSEAFDPLEKSIEVFRALDAVKEASVKFVTRKLPPGIDDAIEAGVEAITDPASDTYAAARGNATLLVGGDSDGGVSANRVVYKRKDKENKAIIGGGATVKKFFASDVRPNSLTSKLDAGVMMEAGATGNGFAKAYLESVYGTLLVGVCECPDGVSVKFLTDVQMFIRTDAAKGAVDVALRDMQSAVDRINQDIQSGKQDIGGEALKKRAAAELRGWGDGTAGERFKPAEGRGAE